MSEHKSEQQWSNRDQCVSTSHSTGQRCKGRALPESMFCFSHDPRLSERRAAGNVKGGKNRANLARLQGLVPPRLLSVYDRLELALADVHAGKLDPRIASAMAQLGRAMVAVIQAGEVEQRLREVEAAVEQAPKRWTL